MRVDDVERLHECFLAQLPVAAHDFRDMRFDVARLRRPTREVRRQVAEEFGERLRLRIHVDEYPAAPGVGEHRRQREFFLVDVWKVPLRRHAARRAVQVPAEAVEWADETRRVTRFAVTQPAAAMATYVVMRADAVRSAYDDDRVRADVVDDVIADLGDFLFAA